MKHIRPIALPLCALLMVGSAAYAQDPPPQQDPQEQTGGGRGGRAAEPVIRPNEKVITKDAQWKSGRSSRRRIRTRVLFW